MDIRSIIAPTIHDRVSLEEFAEALTDRAPEVEYDVARLRKLPGDREITASLFRAVHNIKGDAALCKFELGVAIAHPIETLLGRFREGEILFSAVLAEMILLAVDRLELATEALLANKSLDNLELGKLVLGLEAIAPEPAHHIDAACADLIEAVTGFPPVIPDISGKTPRPSSSGADHKNAASDLQFFRSLALQFESRSPLFKGRTMRILRLALETNKAGKDAVDAVQLEAAVYLHDLGMMLLPESIWLKIGKMSPQEKLTLENHPGFAAGLLQRMPGWEEAAKMIAQHHEMPDGGGYPNRLHHADICSGAKILAIVDAFEAVMLKHIHRGKNRSVLRAVAEINACDNQFSPDWIEPFNAVIRKTVEN
ncbi:HD domain-containing phosphohydrolase [Dechloromonas sp. HYN0024]|uniref:HD domain-containing phosphohydrolase n=1 Tax=Dechloromonas sp. HYN0024 TaxID=2231055 RepID=UPI000E42EDF1|nr:HD domain-containing phosphohydrolase [Dechloromonas sp. HYN0024]AXS79070.1 HD domain-containing protein [Dechloromonas sp. HYN0024]